MNKPRKPFAFKQFTIHQNGAALPVTTDACLFGALAEFDQPLSILDLGTGTGLLLHMMAQKYPDSTLYGIDNHLESLNCAKLNVEFNDKSLCLKDRVHLHNGDFFDHNHIIFKQKFDAIISNPPFFENQLMSKNELKIQARHFQNGSFRKYMNTISTLLNDNGVAWILLPNINESLKQLMKEELLIVQEIIQIHPTPIKKHHLELIKLSKIPKSDSHTTKFYVRDEFGNHSNAFKMTLSSFYL
jgi:tRNA1Val (adenine37-N6)-methyltransferase